MSDGAAVGAWRTRDIVVTAIIGVAFGVVMWAWNQVWAALPSFWANDVLYGVWLIPAVLAPLIVRKPGAALFAELVAAGLSAYLGSQWGIDALVSGIVQGGAAELVFALTRYRSWTFPTLAVAGIASAAAAWVHDWILYYAGVALEVQLLRGLLMGISGVVIVAFGSVLLVNALRTAGVLQGFPGGQPPAARAG
jgi:energy-coupling factor transport system substrate-specific component